MSYPFSTAETEPSVVKTESPVVIDLRNKSIVPAKTVVLGKLPPLIVETPFARWSFFLVAIVAVVGFFVATQSYWAPAHPGIDQNGYLVGAKMFQHTGSTGFVPDNRYQYVGSMWVENGYGKYYPKYPLGLSALYALTLKLGGAKFGIFATMMVSPIMMTLAMLATYFLIRLAAGSFAAALGVLIVASSSVTLGLTNNPNSHATALCCVTWGMYLLIRWWQRNGILRAMGAGVLLGVAVSIRYTEGLELLPLALVILFNLPLKNKKIWIQSSAMVIAWLIPTCILATYNWVTMHTLTGYDPTNESTGFTWQNFTENWETMVRQLYNTGLFFILPFSLLGMILMWRWNWRFALVLASWIVPSLIVYTAYYWAPDNGTIMYLRFYLTIFPALALSAAWAMKKIVDLLANDGSRVLSKFAIAAVIALGCGVSVNTATAEMEADSATNNTLVASTKLILAKCPANSVIFAQGSNALNFLQLAGDYQLYDLSQFNSSVIRRYERTADKMDQPSGLQPQRAVEMFLHLRNYSDADLLREQNKLMTDAFAKKQRVFLMVPKNALSAALRFLPRRDFVTSVVGMWEEPPRVSSNGANRKSRDNRRAGMLGPRGAAAGMAGMFPGLPPMMGMSPDQPATWQLIEVKSAPPVFAPPTKSRSRSTTQPVTRSSERPISSVQRPAFK